MQRYFIHPQHFSDHEVTIIGDDVHHIVKVMRSQVGDQIIICDGLGRSAVASIKELADKQVRADVVELLDEQKELPIQVTIGQGLPKSDKLEWIIQKGTELGAYAFFPFASERSVVKWDEKKEGKKLERWNRIAKEAAEQSHRTRLPEVFAPCSFAQAIQEAAKHTAAVIAYEKENGRSMHELVDRLAPGDTLFVFIGPEGGFSEQEVQKAEAAGIVPVSLGPRILRTETASQYILAALSYHFEQ